MDQFEIKSSGETQSYTLLANGLWAVTVFADGRRIGYGIGPTAPDAYDDYCQEFLGL